MLAEDYENVLDTEGKRICSIISSSATQMGLLIDDLLRFSRISRNSLNPGLVNMSALVSSAIEENAGEKDKERIKFFIHPLHQAFGDANLMKVVWNNLVSNAIKYSSKEPSPEIHIGSKKEEGFITYFIKDNGVGFNMKYAHKLFNVFQRLHSEKEFEGNGVGLAIVQQVISKHGGKVWAESKMGQGATFYFSLPVVG
jgi:light-regulated signal transduction histidine kinase (bacteriophytochrome)